MTKNTTQNILEGRKITAEEPKILKDGVHTGVIGNCELRTAEKNGETFEYFDILIDVEYQKDDSLITLKTGFPLTLSEVSSLGQFLKKSGFELETGKEYSLEKIKQHLLNKEVTFQTTQTETKKGTFARVLRETLKFK